MGSARRIPATARWQDRGGLVEVVEAEGKHNNKTQKNVTGSAVSVYIKPRPPPTLGKNTHGTFLLARRPLLRPPLALVGDGHPDSHVTDANAG